METETAVTKSVQNYCRCILYASKCTWPFYQPTGSNHSSQKCSTMNV